MKTLQVRGLVIREQIVGESDKRLTIFCKEFGKITVYARGARKAKSKFLAAAQQFTYADFVVAEGGQFFSLTQADIITGFYEIRQNYETLCHAQYILEICEKTIPSRTPSDDILQLTLKTLQHINRNTGLKPIPVFLFRFFLCNGIAPELENCCVCGQSQNQNRGALPHTPPGALPLDPARSASLDPHFLLSCSSVTYSPKSSANLQKSILFCKEGVVCENCQKSGKIPVVSHDWQKSGYLRISAAAWAAICHILAEDLPNAFALAADDSVVSEIMQAALLCFRHGFNVKILAEIW